MLFCCPHFAILVPPFLDLLKVPKISIIKALLSYRSLEEPKWR
jgi:hypothetical protein